MSAADPIQLLFGGMAKLGPGGAAHTRHVLGLLPERPFRTVVDAGCGAGASALVLAEALGVRVHAVDTHAPFLAELERRAEAAGLLDYIEPHLLDMRELPEAFEEIDLLWSEGAAYNLGFAEALRTWRAALAPGGFVVVSELCWLKASAPEVVAAFFRTGYPTMQSVEANAEAARAAGYRVLATYTLPPEAWIEGYYDTLAPRARRLLDHPEATVREFAAETLREILVFGRSEESYGYVFYVLQRKD